MKVFAIGDLHLSGGTDKPMDVFGPAWQNHAQRIADSWSAFVSQEDLVLLPGDFSWAMHLDQTKSDMAWLAALPGTKLLIRGNHDYWWSTKTKMESFFKENSLDTLNILFNNCYEYNNFGICGTRGWVSINGDTENERVMAREVQRLEVSILDALSKNLDPIVFMHYPPVYASTCNYDILDILFRYKIKRCFYGHIHGYSQRNAITGSQDGIEYRMISSDYLHFAPLKVV